MARKPVDFAAVRKLAMALPDVEETTSARGPAFKVHGKLLAWPPPHASVEAGSLAVLVPADLRAELLASQPDVYYSTPHYDGHPVVLVRLALIGREALRQLLGTAWLFVSSAAPQARARARKKGARVKARE
jgi:hypothetical protein